MSHLLWKYYWENDVDRFRRLLAPAGHSHSPYSTKSPAPGVGSPGAYGNSPRPLAKLRKASAHGANALSKADVNGRDHVGLTILLRAASSTSPNAVIFVEALLAHPATDIYAQDPESGWNALHRALYNGNISIARLLLEKERRDIIESLGVNTTTKVGQLIKTKDHEGNSPFDVYNASIALRQLRMAEDDANSDDDSGSEDAGDGDERGAHSVKMNGVGEEVFTFGSNRNLSLGLGDEDDRQFPERVYLKRPDHLIQYFHDHFVESQTIDGAMEESRTLDSSEISALTQNRPLMVQDVVMAKLHTAIITTDPISNLYVCGIGRGGRLGLGDENTQFTFQPVQAGLLDKRVTHVALGLNHSMAITSGGELWTWGSNSFSQLGYALPPPMKPDEEPISTTPRQVFGPLKKEIVVGIAASSIHSVAHTGSSLYCWGKNAGQLALMDADSRSLEVQSVPRKVAASLLSSHSSILMVSAIDRATTVLFEDRTVCVFTNYGYNMIKFPFYDGFTNSTLQRSGRVPMSSRFNSGRREIHAITSGGETIAALTGSGDLFTMALNHKAEGHLQATSTTNPAKIKDAITTPQLTWNSLKDGAKSVAIGEDGTIMVSTQSGAVWRRVKRTKAKDAKNIGNVDNKRKDFKFQRVPYITGIVGVRSSMFGAYAAIRKDCDVTREQLEVDDQTLWHDLAPLCPLKGFRATNPRLRENKDTWKFQNPEVLMGRVDTLGYEILTCTDLEEDLAIHLRSWNFKHDETGLTIRTTSAPELQIPVHSWVLAARSPVLRAALLKFRETGDCVIPDLLTISDSSGTTTIELCGIDLIALLNLVVYAYVDRVIPAWNFTRQSPPLAYRYRQIRIDLMGVAAKLGMAKLEHSVRIQSTPPKSMDQDFRSAIEDPNFLEDGDALLELDGDEIPVHTSMLCQRCPWFAGLFKGRSGGMWLASRRAGRDASERTPIDLKHIHPESFHYVLQHMYADVGEDLFDNVVAESIDDFSELVMDVMSIANELMLDRLSQICQHVLGRFVTTRNISTLMNLMSPCSVTKFKDVGLEYICLQMETMLENHLLDNLDEDLVFELDEVVRDNQLARCPFAKSGRADLLLHERHPTLAEDIEEERQIRVKAMAYKVTSRDDDKKLSSSFKAKFGSFDDNAAVSPLLDKSRRQSKSTRNEPFSPVLRPKNSKADLIFDMEEEESSMASPSPSPRPMDSSLRDELDQLPSLEETHSHGKGKQVIRGQTPTAKSPASYVTPGTTPINGASDLRRTSNGGNPWAKASLSTTKLDLKDIMAESKPARSALSAGLAAQSNQPAKLTPQKMTQKEKKKFMQQQADEQARLEALAASKPQVAWTQVGEKKSSPWLPTPSAPKTSLKDTLMPTTKSTLAPPVAKHLVAGESSNMPIPRRAASPDTRFSGQSRSGSGSTTPRGNLSKNNSGGPVSAKSMPPQHSPSQASHQEPKPLVPHSKSYIQKPQKQTDNMLGLGLADIIGQQQREQQSVKEAAAKRNLEEIQQEQAFQEWWDAESRRIQDEEARRQNREKNRDEKKGGGNRRGRGGKPKGGPSKEQQGTAAPTSTPAEGPTSGGAGAGARGRGKSRRGGGKAVAA